MPKIVKRSFWKMNPLKKWVEPLTRIKEEQVIYLFLPKELWSQSCYQTNQWTTHFCCCLVLRLGPTLWDPMECHLPGSSVWSGLPFPLQGIFPTQGLNPHFLNFRWILYCWPTREAQHTTTTKITNSTNWMNGWNSSASFEIERCRRCSSLWVSPHRSIWPLKSPMEKLGENEGEETVSSLNSLENCEDQRKE